MKQHHISLLILLAVVFVTILPSGLLMLVRPGASLLNLPSSILSYSIFKKFFMLSFFSSIAVGAISLITFICVLKSKINARLWCYITSITLAGWVVTQVVLAGQVNWLQVMYFITAITITLFADMNARFRHPYFKH